MRQEGLIDYLRAIRQRWPIVLLVALVVAGTALVLSLLEEERYEARATLLLRDEQRDLFGEDAQAGDAERQFNTDVDLIRLSSVAETVARRLELDVTSDQLLQDVTTETNASSDVVELVASADDPRDAALIANVYAQAYVDYRRSTARESLADAAELAAARLEALAPDERDSREGELLATRQRELEIAAALETGGVRVVRRATVPSSPASPRPLLSAAVGGILGLLLGALLAVALAFADRRLRDEQSVEETFGLPVIAEIPHVGAGDAAAEPHGLLAAHLRLASRNGSRVVMFTSPAKGDGKSFTTLGVARALTRLGQRVVVIEADLRAPVLEPEPNVYDTPSGLVALLVRARADVPGELVWLDASTDPTRSMDLPADLTFGLLPAGGTPPDPQRLLARPEMAAVVERVRGLADVVLIDTAPIGTVSDAVALAPLVDSVILVARMGKTTRDAARAASRILRNIDANLEGVVVNDVRGVEQPEYYGAPRPPAVVPGDGEGDESRPSRAAAVSMTAVERAGRASGRRRSPGAR